MNPRILAFVLGIFVGSLRVLVGCYSGSESDLKAAAYATTLEECNRTATSLCDSIVCENKARASNGRFPRDMPASCKDGGAQ